MVGEERDLAKLLATDEPQVDTASGLRRFRESVAEHGVEPYRAPERAWPLRATAAAATVAVLFAGLTVTGLAESFLTIFEPKQVAPVVIGSGDLASLPELSDYGTVEVTTKPAYRQAETLDEAQAVTGIAPLRPVLLPADVTGDPLIYTVSHGEGTFRFDAAKLAASAERVSRTPPPMPAAIAASTLHVRGGPAVVQSYGGAFDPRAVEPGPGSGMPTLLIAQSRAPVIRSDGATIDELRAFLLAQPGISPRLAAQIRAIGDPSATLLVPIPMDFASGREVTVRGTRGVLVGDSTGIGGAVVWVADGIVHVVAGSYSENELLQVANSLR
ncbi:MAG TPA: hypothetical protein VMJ92_02025 [Candidatus Limnocylindrales bacterium]|nr:hypothetical protein [Candidatus Limnocylindrales bacterium]